MEDQATQHGRTAVEEKILCVIPSGFARRLADLIDAYYAEDPRVDVIVDRRGGERRFHERRSSRARPPGYVERRRPGSDPRRGDRRRPMEWVDGVDLPRWARSFEGVIQFVRPRR